MNAHRVKIPVATLIGLLLGLLLTAPAGAVRVDDLYGATVELSDTARDPMNDAFAQALAAMLIKVTGQPEAGTDAVRRSIAPNPAAFVQEYSRLPDNQLRVSFDRTAIRAALDAAGLPVWGEVRPLVGVWVAADSGAGRRVILSEGADDAETEASSVDELRQILADTAGQRGLPIVFPLVDAVDLGVVSFTDIWGDFREPVLRASERYGAEVVLIGRARSLDPQDDRVRWTLLVGAEELTWTGDISSGPAQAAELLAQRLATFADAADTLRVLVRDVDTLDKYGQLQNYFASLNIVERVSVARVNGNDVEFDLVVRGDLPRLERVLIRNKLLQRAEPVNEPTEFGRIPDLAYEWVAEP